MNLVLTRLLVAAPPPIFQTQGCTAFRRVFPESDSRLLILDTSPLTACTTRYIASAIQASCRMHYHTNIVDVVHHVGAVHDF